MGGFNNSVLGGAETLIRTAIKSFNYVAGALGWRIGRDGSAELNNAVIRGSLSAGGGNVLLNSNGLHIQGVVTQYDLNGAAGFLARNSPDNGVQTQITPGGMFLTSQDPSPLGNGVEFADWFVGYDNPGAANETPYAVITGNSYTGKTGPTIVMLGQVANDPNPDSSSQIQFNAFSLALNAAGDLQLNANTVTINGTFSRPNVTYTFSKSIPSGATTNINNADYTVVRDSYPGLYNNGLFVASKTGVWLFTVHARWQSQAAVTGLRMIRYQVNGVDRDYSSVGPSTGLNGTLITNEMTVTELLNAGDFIQFQAFQTSGGALTLGNSAKVHFELLEG